MRPDIPVALRVTQLVLRLLVVLNGVYGAVVLAILVGLFVAAPWTLTALGFGPAADAAPLLGAMRWIAALGLVGVPLNVIVLDRLLGMVATVRAGDPFVARNAVRLQAIAWAELGVQLLQLAVGILAERDREYLLAELRSAVGLAGRQRVTGGSAERARTAVTRSVRYALGRLAEHHPTAAAHLEQRVRTGTYCSYAPDPVSVIEWET